MAATKLVEDHPAANLDYSPESLERLDDLIAEEFDWAGPEATREERLSESDPAKMPDDMTFQVGQSPILAGLTGYVGAVFLRQWEGHWAGSEVRPFIRLQTPDGRTGEFEIYLIVFAATKGHVLLAAVFEDMKAQIESELQ